jgi:hypothetical protein
MHLPVKEMNSKALHSGCSITTKRASFDKIMLSDMFVLEMSAHGNLALETSVAYRTMIGQAFGVCCKMFSQMIFSEKSFLTDATFIRLHAGVAHFVSTHVGAI